MRRRSYRIVLAILLTLPLAAISFAQNSAFDPTQAETELKAVHAQLSAAMESGDTARVLSFYAPNFTMRLRNGKVLTLDDLSQLRRLAETPQTTERKVTTAIQKFKLVGTEAVIAVDHSGDTTFKLDDGSLRRIVEVTRQQERWIKQANDWKLLVVEDIESKKREVTLNGQKDKQFIPSHAVPIEPNADDQAILSDGYGIIFIYRMKDGTIIKPPIYCNDGKVAQMTGGSFLRIKLRPGTYSLKSDKGDPISINVEASKISLLQLKMDAGFPKARGVLQLDKSIIAAEAYKLPRLLDLTSLGRDNIADPTKVVR